MAELIRESGQKAKNQLAKRSNRLDERKADGKIRPPRLKTKRPACHGLALAGRLPSHLTVYKSPHPVVVVLYFPRKTGKWLTHGDLIIHLLQSSDWRYQVATINLRDVPEDLHRKAKARAAMEGVTLKQLILRLLEEYLDGVC